MVDRSIQDASKSVGPIGRTQVAWLIGTRVAEAILASGQTPRINRPDIWMQAIRSNLTKLLCHGGRPHMGPGSRFACPGRQASSVSAERIVALVLPVAALVVVGDFHRDHVFRILESELGRDAD